MKDAFVKYKDLVRGEVSKNSESLPGIKWVWLGLIIFVFSGFRNVLFYWGIPIPLRLVSQVSGIIGGSCIVWGIRRYTSSMHVIRLVRPNHRLKIIIWYVLLVVFMAVGIFIGNSPSVIGKEFIILWMFGEFWMVGADDRFWLALEKPLTIIFYVAASLVLLYYKTPGVVTGALGSEQVVMGSFGNRYIGTLGYNIKPMLGSGLFLFAWGVVKRRNDIWRTLQIGALVVSFIVSVGIFKFRGAAFSYVFIVVLALFLRPVLEKRIKLWTTASWIFAMIVGLCIFVQSDAFKVLKNRTVTTTQKEGIFESRLDEFSAYTTDLGLQALIGRGLGGHYDASGAIDNDAANEWYTCHLGLVVFSLKGGLALLGVFLSIVVAGFKIRPRYWYGNPMNLTATLLFPILVLNFALNPFTLKPEAIFTYLPAMIVLARFGCRFR